MSDFTIVPVRTAYDPPADSLTVATPSCCCCCCCCCCLNTISAATTFATTEANLVARNEGGNRALATTLGLASVPAGLATTFVLADSGNRITASSVFGALVVMAVLTAALIVAGRPPKRAAGVAVVVSVAMAVLVVIEFFVALATALLVELLFPAAAYLGYATGRSRNPLPWIKRPDRRVDRIDGTD